MNEMREDMVQGSEYRKGAWTPNTKEFIFEG